ncbi:uncharacterized protein LOC144354646 [Saccoglossus kowalevskii]
MITEKMSDEVESLGNVFHLSEKEKKDRLFHIKYNGKDDRYYRYSGDVDCIKGWKRGIYTMVNIKRSWVENNGEEQVYLTRRSGYASASVSWKFDFRESDLVIDAIQAVTYGRTETGGRILYDMVSQDVLDVGLAKRKGKKYLLNGWQTLLIVAYLDGDPGIRHSQTQLLYQNITKDPEFCPLDITITLKPLKKKICTCGKEKRHTSASSRNKYDSRKTSNAVCDCRQCTCPIYNRTLKDKRQAKYGRSKKDKVIKEAVIERYNRNNSFVTQNYGETHLKVPMDTRLSFGDVAERANSNVSCASDFSEHATDGRSPSISTMKSAGSEESVKPSTSKEYAKYISDSENASGSQGNIREAWGEKMDQEKRTRISHGELTDETDTAPLTPNKKNKKCIIM